MQFYRKGLCAGGTGGTNGRFIIFRENFLV